MRDSNIKVALIGNPNTGKTSVFNLLTGLNQQVGNYPGITVEKKQGFCHLTSTTDATISDLPGTYSLNASSLDENVVIELLLNKNDPDFPDVVVLVTDVENLKRNLLLFTQIKDLEIPTIMVINMIDRMELKGITLDVPYLENQLKTKIVLVSSRKKIGIENLKKSIVEYQSLPTTPCLNASSIDTDYFEGLRKAFPNQSLYKLWLVITQDVNFSNLNKKTVAPTNFAKSEADLKRLQQKETIKRYQFINDVLKVGRTINIENAKDFRSKLDRVLTHKLWGYIIFVSILILIFQSIFDWSSYPMDLIDSAFAAISSYTSAHLPPGAFTNLLAQGIIPGIGGILIFIPQIAFLFMFVSILEETGYMSRVVFFNGQNNAKIWSFWQKCRAVNLWNCLCYSGNYGNPKHRKLERTADYNSSNAFYNLLRTPSCLFHHYSINYSKNPLARRVQHARINFTFLVFIRFRSSYFVGIYFKQNLKITMQNLFCS
jgi:ferrous iron transport protein B